MEEKKYPKIAITIDDLTKWLRICANDDEGMECSKCPFTHTKEGCSHNMMMTAVDKLEKLNKDNDVLKERCEHMAHEVSDLYAEKCDLIEKIKAQDNVISNLKDRNATQMAEKIELRQDLEAVKETAKFLNRKADELEQKLTDKDKRIEELEQELEEMEDSQHIIADFQMLGPDDDDLQQIVNYVSDICTNLVQHKRIKPITLLRYIEDVIYDRERRRVWNPDTEEME